MDPLEWLAKREEQGNLRRLRPLVRPLAGDLHLDDAVPFLHLAQRPLHARLGIVQTHASDRVHLRAHRAS